MDYSLAKELKEAGFVPADPRAERPNSWVSPDGDYGDWNVSDEYIYVPSLEELIEACGDKFKILTRDKDLISQLTDAPWAAMTEPSGGLIEVGAIPAEAVARLWLALNKKAK